MYAKLVAFLRHPNTAKYSKNITWMFFARMFTMGVSFITTLYIARTLGPTNFGELDYALAVIGVLAPLASFGISNVLQRELIKHPEDTGKLFGTAFAVNAFFAFLATLIALLFAYTSHYGYLSGLLIVILSSTFLLGIFQLLLQEFYARVESKLPSVITMFVWVVISISKVYVLMLGKGVLWLAAISVGEQILYALFSLFTYALYGRYPLKTWTFSSSYTSILLKTGFAGALASFFTLVYARIDQIFIRHMIDAHAVGLYSSGVRLVDVWNIVPGALLSGLYPAIVNMHASDKKVYGRRMKHLFWILISTAVFIAFLITLFAPFLMRSIFGSEFIGGTTSLQVYAWSIPGTFLGIYVMNILFTEDSKRALVIMNLLPACVNIALNLWLIPLYGIVGAANATVIAYSLTPVVPLLFTRTRAHFREIFE